MKPIIIDWNPLFWLFYHVVKFCNKNKIAENEFLFSLKSINERLDGIQKHSTICTYLTDLGKQDSALNRGCCLRILHLRFFIIFGIAVLLVPFGLCMLLRVCTHMFCPDRKLHFNICWSEVPMKIEYQSSIKYCTEERTENM